MSATIDTLRRVTHGTEYEGRLFIVGGIPRDRALGWPVTEDVDIVLEGDALELAAFFERIGISDHAPVLYPRFGTAMVTVAGHQVEMVTARSESYEAASRKPNVQKATLKDDVFRRDFTINTLLENLHTGEILDLTGRACEDLAAGIIRTPLEPRVTFHDDPLRMLRAIRFAVRFGFEIEAETWEGICRASHRLNLMGPEPPVVSAERIRDEFLKIVTANGRTVEDGSTKSSVVPDSSQRQLGMTSRTGLVRGLHQLRKSGLLHRFFPELLEMAGITQNDWHLFDVWEHTLEALAHLKADAPLELRLGLLLHDVGKPRTRTEDEKGVHFYEHQFVGAEMAREALHRLKLTNDQVKDVTELVRLHMRLGESRPEWSDAAIKRLMRDTTEYRKWLFELSRCDHAAMRQDAPVTNLDALRARMEELDRLANVAQIHSPLDGLEIMQALNIPPGPKIKEAKDFLTNEVIEGRLSQDDKEAAREALVKW